MTAIVNERSQAVVATHIKLPDKLSSIKKAEQFSSLKLKWNSSEEVLSVLISFDKHESWFSRKAPKRPPNGSMLLFDRQNVKDYRKDGYTWKKRTSSSTYIREDHCKLKVAGVLCLNVVYTHSAIVPSFHRRIYWLLQNPDIVLVHYLNLIDDLKEEDLSIYDKQKANILCQITSIFSGVGPNQVPNFEVTESEEQDDSCQATNNNTKKVQQQKKLFKVTITPKNDYMPASLANLPQCVSSPYPINSNHGNSISSNTSHGSSYHENVITSSGSHGNSYHGNIVSSTGSHGSSYHGNIMQSSGVSGNIYHGSTCVNNNHHGNLAQISLSNNNLIGSSSNNTQGSQMTASTYHGNFSACSIPANTLPLHVMSPLPLPSTQNRPIQSAVLFTPICNIQLANQSRHTGFKTTGSITQSIDTPTSTVRFPATVTSTLNVPLRYIQPAPNNVPAETPTKNVPSVSVVSQSQPAYSSTVGSQPVLFLNSESNSTVTSTSSSCTFFSSNNSSSNESGQNLSLHQAERQLPGTSQNNVPQGLNEHSQKGPLETNPSDIDERSSSVSSSRAVSWHDNRPANHLTEQLSSSPSSDYGSLLSESGTRFSGSSGSNGYDGPFRLPLPVTQSSRVTQYQSISHDPSTALNSNLSDTNNSSVDSNQVNMSFDFSDLHPFDELDYGLNFDFNSVIGDYFNSPESFSASKENNKNTFQENEPEINDKGSQRQMDVENEDQNSSKPNSPLSSTYDKDSATSSSISVPGCHSNSCHSNNNHSNTLHSNNNHSNNDYCNSCHSNSLHGNSCHSNSVHDNSCHTPVNDIVMATSPKRNVIRMASIDSVNAPPAEISEQIQETAENKTTDTQRDIPVNKVSIMPEPINNPSLLPVVMPGSACITDFSPEWSYPEGGVKVLVTGEWSSSNMSYTCLFDGCSVEAVLIQVGVLRCFCPPHEPGLVTLQVALNGFIVSNACVFEYRAHDSPGDLNTQHEWLTMDDARFKIALLDRLEQLESRLSSQSTDSTWTHSDTRQKQRCSFEERVLFTCRVLFNLKDGNRTGNIKRPYRGMTLMHLAAALGFSKLLHNMVLKLQGSITSEVVRQELDPSRKDEFNCTPLMWACALGQRAAVAELLSCHANALLVPDACGRLPLQLARDRGYFEIVDCIEEFAMASSERKSLFNLGSSDDDNDDTSESLPSPNLTPSSTTTGQQNCPSLPSHSQPVSMETSYTDRACSPMHVEEFQNGSVLLNQALVQIHEMINEAERQADLEAGRLPLQLSPVREENDLLPSPGGWPSSGNRFRSFSSTSSQSSPLTPSSKSSLSPGSPAFLNSPHSSPGLPPDTKEFHEFLCSSKKLLEKNFSELTLTDREQQELYEAALIIQEAYRSYKIRRQQHDQEIQAAVLIQNHYRRYKQVQFLLYKKRTHAALIIQNQYRAYREHEQFKKSRRAAAIIQNQFRIYRLRRQSKRRRDEHKSKQQEARFIRQSSNRSNTSV